LAGQIEISLGSIRFAESIRVADLFESINSSSTQQKFFATPKATLPLKLCML